MDNYNKKIVSTVKFNFNDIPKFEENNRYINNNIKNSNNTGLKRSISSKLIKTLPISHEHLSLSLQKTKDTKKNGSIIENQDLIYKKANLKSNSVLLKRNKSSKSLKPLINSINNKNYDDNNLSLSKFSIKKANCTLNETYEKKKEKIFDRKKSLDLLNIDSHKKNKINTNNHIKQINCNLNNINLNSLEKNENIINNENHFSTITSRVKQLEQQLSITMKELHEKNNIIYELKKELKEKNELLEISNDEKIILLQNKYQKSQEKLKTAYDCLKQNNIIIDDDKKSVNDSLESSILTKENINTNDDYLSNQYFNKFPYDYDQFSKQIKFLNHLAEEGIGQIVQHKNGAYTIKMPDPQILNVYSNGFIFNEVFHSFRERDSLLFIKEILDGYFPFQLKEKYPEGVPFKLIDNHTSYYNSRASYIPYSGKGALARTLSSSLSEKSNDNSLNNDKNSEKYSYERNDEVQFISSKNYDYSINKNINNNQNRKAKLLESTKESFLNSLQKNTVKDGCVIDIRKATKNILFNDSNDKDQLLNSNDILETSFSDEEENLHMNRIDDTESIEDKLTTLKIRNDSNEYIIQMKYTDTIKKLKEYIEKKLLIKKEQFKLRMPFQFNEFEDNCTLEKSSLVPNACLYIEML